MEADEAANTTIIDENGLKLHVDVENGQKTGYFLDQKANRVLLREMAHGKCHGLLFAYRWLCIKCGVWKCQSGCHCRCRSALDQAYANAKSWIISKTDFFVKADVQIDIPERTVRRGRWIPCLHKTRRTIDHAYSGWALTNRLWCCWEEAAISSPAAVPFMK